MSSTDFATIASPSPVPPALRVLEGSSWVKRANAKSIYPEAFRCPYPRSRIPR